ncbi:MAG: hypothetical protein RJB39_682 [Candidatus Parcubacteria bacterium]|jgi:hypothetical protein
MLKSTIRLLLLCFRPLSFALKWLCPGTRALILPFLLTLSRLANDLFDFTDIVKLIV